MGKLSQGKTVFREENKKNLKKVKKTLKKCEKTFDKGCSLWYYRQAHDREGMSAEQKLGKRELKNRIRKK